MNTIIDEFTNTINEFIYPICEFMSVYVKSQTRYCESM